MFSFSMSKTILIVDDSELVLKVLSNKLKKSGYNILTETNGHKALEFLDGRNIDLLITDLNMPEMDGIELIKAVRSNNYYQFIPIILFLSEEVTDRKHITKQSGATINFDKGDIKEKLLSTVKKLIR